MGTPPDHAGAGRRVDLGLRSGGAGGGQPAHGAGPARRWSLHRRRIGIALAGFGGGALVLAVIGLIAGWAGYAVGQMALAGAGSGLLLSLALVGALEDGEVQRTIDEARGTRIGPADR